MALLPLRTPYTSRPRHTFLGGSDVAALLNKSPFKTRRQLWLEKSGQVGDNFLESHHLRRGKRLEDVAAAMFLERHGGKFQRRLPTRDSALPEWMGGTPDRLWVSPAGELELLDLKVPGVDNWARMQQTLEVSIGYQCQLWHYLRQYPAVERGRLVFYQPDLDELLVVVVERDEELMDLLLTEEVAFWRAIEDGVVPPDCGWEPPPALPAPDAPPLLCSEAEAAAILESAGHYHEAKAVQREAEKLAEACRIELLQLVGTRAGKLQGQALSVSVSPEPRRSLDPELLRAAAPLDREKVLALLADCDLLKVARDPRWATCLLDVDKLYRTTTTPTIRTKAAKVTA